MSNWIEQKYIVWPLEFVCTILMLLFGWNLSKITEDRVQVTVDEAIAGGTRIEFLADNEFWLVLVLFLLSVALFLLLQIGILWNRWHKIGMEQAKERGVRRL